MTRGIILSIQVTPCRSNDKAWCFIWSFKSGFNFVMKNASRIFLLWKCKGADAKTFHVNICDLLSARSLAGPDLPVVLSCSLQWRSRYVDDTITKRKKITDIVELLQNMNSHDPNIKLIVETNPTRFLDIIFSKNLDGSVMSKVFRKPGKLPTFWNSQIPKR